MLQGGGGSTGEAAEAVYFAARAPGAVASARSPLFRGCRRFPLPCMCYSDLRILGGARSAPEDMLSSKRPHGPGQADKNISACASRMPPRAKGHVRDMLSRMGLDDQAVVALPD